MASSGLRAMVDAERLHRDHLDALAKERVRQWLDGFRPLWREVAHLNVQAEQGGLGELSVRHSGINYIRRVETLSGCITALRADRRTWRRGQDELVAEWAITDEGRIVEIRFAGHSRPYPTFDNHTVRDALPQLRTQAARVFA